MSKQKKKKLLKIAIGSIATAAISAAVISSAVSCGSGSSSSNTPTQNNSTTTNNNTANLELDVVDATTNQPLQIVNNEYQVTLGEKVRVSIANSNDAYKYSCTQDVNNKLSTLDLDNNEVTLPIDENSSLTFTGTETNSASLLNQTINFNVTQSTYNASLVASGSTTAPGTIVGSQLFCSPNDNVDLTFNLSQVTEGKTVDLNTTNFVSSAAATFTLYGSSSSTTSANTGTIISTNSTNNLATTNNWTITVNANSLTSYKYFFGCFNLPNNQKVYTQAYTTVASTLVPVAAGSQQNFPENSDGSYSIAPTLGVLLKMDKDFALPSSWKSSDVKYNWYYSTDNITWNKVGINTTTNNVYTIDSFAGNNSGGVIGQAGWYRLEITNSSTKQTIYTNALDLKSGPVTGFSPEIMIGSKQLQSGTSFTLYSTEVPLSNVKFGAIISGVFVPADKLENAKLTYTINKGKVENYSPSTTLLLTEGANVIDISESFEFNGITFNESVTLNVNCYNTIVLGPSGVSATAQQTQSYDAAYGDKITLGPTGTYADKFNGGTYEWYQVTKVTSANGDVYYEKTGSVLSTDLNYSFTVNSTTPTYYELIATMPAYIGANEVYQSVTSEPIEVVPTITNTTATITPVGLMNESQGYVSTNSVINVNAAIAYDKMELNAQQVPDAKVSWKLNGSSLTATGFALNNLNLTTGKNTLSVSITYSFNTSTQTTITSSITIYYYALGISPTNSYEETNGDWSTPYGSSVTLQINAAQQSIFQSGFTYQWFEVVNGAKTGSALSTESTYTFTYDTNDTTSYELIATTSGGVQVVSNVVTIQPTLQTYSNSQILSDIVNKLSTNGKIDAETEIPSLGSTQVTNSNVPSIIESYLKGKFGDEITISGAGYNTVNVTASDVTYSVQINGNENEAIVTVTYNGSSQTITVTNFYQETLSSSQQIQSLIEQLGKTTTMNSSDQLQVQASLIFGTDNITNSAVTTTAITNYFANQVKNGYKLVVPGYETVTIEGTSLTWSATIDQSDNYATVKVEYMDNGVSTDYSFMIVDFTLSTFTSQQIANVIGQKLSGTTINPIDTTTSYTLNISSTDLGQVNVADSDASTKINSYVDNLISTDFKSAYTLSYVGYSSVQITKSDFTSSVTLNATDNTASITITYGGKTCTIVLTGFTVHYMQAQTILNDVVAAWAKNSTPSDQSKNIINVQDYSSLKNLNVQYEKDVYNAIESFVEFTLGLLPSSDLTFSQPGYSTVTVNPTDITIPNETWTTNSKGVTVGTGGITFPDATAIGSNALNENSVTVKLTYTYHGQTATTDVTFTGFATGQPDGQTAVGLIVDYFTTNSGGNMYYSGSTIGTLDASKTSGPDSIANVPITDTDLTTKLTDYFDSVIGTKGFEIGAAGLPEITVLQSYLTFTYTPDLSNNTVSVKVVLNNTYDGKAYTGTDTFTITNLYLAPIPSQTVVNDIAQKMSDATYTIDASTNSTLKNYYLVNSNIDTEITTYLNSMIGTSGYQISNGSGYQTITITPSDYTLKVTPDPQTETATVTVTYDGASQTITISGFTPDTLTTSQITSWIVNKICDGKTIDAKNTISSLKNVEITNSNVTSDIQSYLTSTLGLPTKINEPGYNEVDLTSTNVTFTVTLNEDANTATVTVEYMNNTTDEGTININDFYLGTIGDSTIASDIASKLQTMTSTDAATSPDTALKSIYLISSDATTQIQSNLIGLIPSSGWQFTQAGANPMTITSADITNKDLSIDVTTDLSANTATVTVTYEGATSSYTIKNFNQPALVVSDANIQQILDSVPMFSDGTVNVSQTELKHLSINNNYAAGTTYVDQTVLSYLQGFVKSNGLTINYPGYQPLVIHADELSYSISSSSNNSYLIVDITYTNSSNTKESATGSIKLDGFTTITSSISDNNVATVFSNSAVPFNLSIDDNGTAVDLTSSDSNLSNLKVTWYNGTTKLSDSGTSASITPNVGVNDVYAVVTFTYYGEPYQITTSTVSLAYECATISDAQSSMTGYGASHTLSYDTAATSSYVPFASTASYQWEISTDNGKTWSKDGAATTKPTPLTFTAWQNAEYRLVISDTANTKTTPITSNVISIVADLTNDTASISASSTDQNVVSASSKYNGSNVEIFYNSDGSATLTVGLSDGKTAISDLSSQTNVTYTWTITSLTASASTTPTTVTTTVPTLSDTFFEKYGACKIAVEIAVNGETLSSSNSWIMTNTTLTASASADSSYMLANDTSKDVINVTEGATIDVTSSLSASVINTKETLPATANDTYVLLSGSTDSLKDATVVSDNTSGKDSGVFTITAPSSITKDETTYYWVEVVTGSGKTQTILATSNAYEVIVNAPISATQTTTPTVDNSSTDPSITFPITYSSALPAIITPTIGTVNVTLSSSLIGTDSPKNTDNGLYSYKISNVTENGFDIVFSSFSKEFMNLITAYSSFYFELSDVEASLSGTTINNVFMSGLTIKTQTISYSNSKFVPPVASTSSSTTSSSSTSSTKATSSSTDSTKVATFTQNGLTDHVYPGDQVELRTNDVLPASWSIQWQQKNADGSWSDLSDAHTNLVELSANYTQPGQSYTFRAKYTNNNTTVYSNETTYTVNNNGNVNIALTTSDK